MFWWQNNNSLQANKKILFLRDVTYWVNLNDERKICIVEKDYHMTDNCFLIKDDRCHLCRREYYPDSFKQQIYERDYVESYSSNQIHANAKYCIDFNLISDKCLRCTDSYGLNTQLLCQLCTESTFIVDSTELMCFQTTSAIILNCQKATTDNACLACRADFFMTPDFLQSKIKDDY